MDALQDGAALPGLQLAPPPPLATAAAAHCLPPPDSHRRSVAGPSAAPGPASWCSCRCSPWRQRGACGAPPRLRSHTSSLSGSSTRSSGAQRRRAAMARPRQQQPPPPEQQPSSSPPARRRPGRARPSASAACAAAAWSWCCRRGTAAGGTCAPSAATPITRTLGWWCAAPRWGGLGPASCSLLLCEWPAALQLSTRLQLRLRLQVDAGWSVGHAAPLLLPLLPARWAASWSTRGASCSAAAGSSRSAACGRCRQVGAGRCRRPCWAGSMPSCGPPLACS